MALYREALPQLGGDLFLTDGGIETTLIFHEGLDLPDFAAFDLLRRPDGPAALRRYFERYVALARRFGMGLVLESATWRASADWGERLGYSEAALAQANRTAIRLLEDIRATHAGARTPMVISGCLGPRGDGYVPGRSMSEDQAQDYHQAQIWIFADTATDMVAALTMTNVPEAVGIARAAAAQRMPVAISFTLETDGRLPSGQPLGEAVAAVDAATGGYPSYYMVNCAHPTHFAHVLDAGTPWLERIRGLRANASCKSHAELNEATELDDGDPVELGRQYAALRLCLRKLNVIGGCCGTDHRHVEQMAMACGGLLVD